MSDPQVNWFRETSNYIEAHRGKTFVIYLGGDAIAHPNSDQVISDITRLANLGIHLVVVHGATPQISQGLAKSSEWHQNHRIMPFEDMERAKEIIGNLSFHLQARLSSGHRQSHSRVSGQSIVSGNFIKARPLGVIDGVDCQQAGQVRKINLDALKQQLSLDAVVLISPLGFSPSGDVFNLSSQDLAFEIAISLQADKLIYTIDGSGILDANGKVISEMLPGMMHQIDFSTSSGNDTLEHLVRLSGEACLKGVDRCHLVSYQEDGALLKELFTRNGTGTQISRHSYEKIRRANADDVSDIIALISPLENAGILVRRSRESLERDIEKFTVIELDGLVIACAALYSYENMGELACLAIHEDYRNDKKGDLLLKAIENAAGAEGLVQLFVLTTQSSHWFTERGFIEADYSCLPQDRIENLDKSRNAKLLVKSLEG